MTKLQIDAIFYFSLFLSFYEFLYFVVSFQLEQQQHD